MYTEEETSVELTHITDEYQLALQERRERQLGLDSTFTEVVSPEEIGSKNVEGTEDEEA
nr:MAG TPA: hypothetical protein [Caudoviricetes sp.]